MAILPLMVWDNTGTPRAYRLLGGTTLDGTQLGAATGFAAAVLDATDGRLPHSRVDEFKSDLYLIHRGTVYKFTFAGKTWTTTAFTLTSAPTSDDQAISALHVMDVNGVSTLIGLYTLSLSSNSRAFWSTDGSTWNESPNFANGGSWPRFTIPYQGKLWAAGLSSSADVWNYDPDAASFASFDIGGVSSNRNGMLINFQGRLFWIGSSVSGSARQLIVFKEYVGGGFADVTYSGGTDPGDMVTKFTAPAGSMGAFEEDGKLYVVFWEMINAFPDLTSGQMQVHEFVPNVASVGGSFQENDISSTVIPAAWLTGGAFDSLGSLSTNVNPYVQVAAPGTPEAFWWRYDDIPAAASTFWTWNGPASLCTVVNSIGSDYAIPSGTNETDEYAYTEGDFDVTMDNEDTRPGLVDFDCQVWLPLDGTTPGSKQGRLYYSIGGDDWQVATISAAVADAPTLVSGAGPAPTVSANLFQGIPVNDSKFQATWDAAADGFLNAGEQFELSLDVF